VKPLTAAAFVRRRKLLPNVLAKPQHRRSDMKKFLTTVAVLTVFATPAFAQSFDRTVGTGNVLPFSYQPTDPQPAASHHEKSAVAQSGLHSFAMVPGVGAGSAFSSNSPDATGGGSIGYNENLRNY
jgi:hypothetical protein